MVKSRMLLNTAEQTIHWKICYHVRIRIEISQAILRVSMIFGKKLVSVPFAPYGSV